MEERLVPVNAVVALYSATRTSWPRPFFDLGYRIEGLEFPIGVDEDERVVPDVVGFKRASSRFVLHEAKSGNNIEEDQAHRYKKVAPATLVRVLSVTVSSGDPLRVQTSYVCLRHAEKRILMGLRAINMEAPVLSFDTADVRAVGAPFDDPDLRSAFSTSLAVPGPPPAIITLDADSPPDTFDQAVFPTLAAAAAREQTSITVAALAEESIGHYAIYPGQYKRRLRRCVADAARRAAEADPQRWEFRPRTGNDDEGLVRILASPELADPRGRTQQYQSMRHRLEAGRPRRQRPENPDQGVFFGSDDLEAELDSATRKDSGEGEEGT